MKEKSRTCAKEEGSKSHCRINCPAAAILLIAASFLFQLIFAGTASAANPAFQNVVWNQLFQADEDSAFEYWVWAIDPDSNYPLDFTDTSNDIGFTVFDMQNFNDTYALINFTPTNDDVGYYNKSTFFLVVVDTLNETDVVRIRFNVSNVNDAPLIDGPLPSQAYLSIHENTSINFTYSHNTSDVDLIWGDVLNSTFLFDGLYNYSTVSYAPLFEFSAGMCISGMHNVTLNVTDLEGAFDNFTWALEINNTNRLPRFNRSFQNMSWEEDINQTDNFTLGSYSLDPDFLECSGLDKDNVTYIVAGNQSIRIDIDPVTFYVSFYPEKDWFGNRTIYFTMNDTYSAAVSSNFTIEITNVQDAPVMDYINESDTIFAVGVNYTYQVLASDPDGDPISYYTNDSLIWINRTTGLISVTASAPDAGIRYVNISVNDTYGASDWQVVKFTILSNSLPVLDPISPSFSINESLTPFVLWVNATDPDNDTLYFTDNSSFFSIQTTSGLGWDARGLINFTPTNSTTGQHFIRISVWDNHSAEDFQVVNFTIININFPPTLDLIPSKSAKVGEEFLMKVFAYDQDIDTDGLETLSYWDDSSFFEINRTTGWINFTPLPSQNGTFEINITVNDTVGLQAAASFLLRIYFNNNPQIGQMPGYSVREDDMAYIVINASDPDGDNLTFHVNTTMFNVTWLNTSGNTTYGLISFYPGQEDIGNHTFLLTANDTHGGLNTTLLRLNITYYNDPPYFSPSIGNYSLWNSIVEGNSYQQWVTAYDEEGHDVNFSSVFISGATIFTIQTYNSSAGLGLLNFSVNSSHIGNYVVMFNVSDSNNFTISIVNFTVQDYNEPPLIVSYTPLNHTLTLPENNSILFNITNATDPEGTNLSYIWMKGNMTLSNTSSYLLSIGFCDSGNFTIRAIVADQDGMNSTLNWSLNITNVNRPPAFLRQIANLTWPEDLFLEDNLSLLSYFNDSDYIECTGINRDTLDFTVNGNHTNISISIDSSFNASFMPDLNWYGNRSVNISLTDQFESAVSNTFVLDVQPVQDAPVLTPITDKIFFKRMYASFVINASDADHDNLTFDDNSSVFNVSYYSDTQGIFEFYVSDWMENKSFSVKVNVTDGTCPDSSCSDEAVFLIRINQTNLPPVISRIYPYGLPVSSNLVYGWMNSSFFPGNVTSFEVSENTTLSFMQESYDPENRSLTYRWLVNGVLNYTGAGFNYSLGFFEQSGKNITLSVSDGYLTSLFLWNMTVSNLNRLPVYGKVRHEGLSGFSSSGSVFSNVSFNSTLNSLELSRVNSSVYYSQGSYTSSRIILEYRGIPGISLKEFRLQSESPGQSNVSFSLRFRSNGTNWSAWTAPYSSGSADLRQLNLSYSNSTHNWTYNKSTVTQLMYRIFFYANQSEGGMPSASLAELSYQIANFTINDTYVSTVNAPVLELDDYFTDPDSDALYYGFIGYSNAGYLGITMSDDKVMFDPDEYWTGGDAVIAFYASDDYYYNSTKDAYIVNNATRVKTNNITIRVQDVFVQGDSTEESQSGGGGGGGGGGGTAQKPKEILVETTKIVEVTDIEILEIIVPEDVIMTSSDEITVPIRIVNNGNQTIKGLTLSAESDLENVSLNFKKYYFSILNRGQQELTELYINRNGTTKTFKVVVKGVASEPKLTDTAVIFIASQVQAVEENFRFVRDMLSSNPECLELNELLDDAYGLIEAGDLEKSQKILDDIASGCRFLISNKAARPEAPKEITSAWASENFRIWVLIGISLFSLSLFIWVKRKNDRKLLERYQPGGNAGQGGE